MFCRIAHWKDGWVLELDPARIETADDGIVFVRLEGIEPGQLAVGLAEAFRAHLFEAQTPSNPP